MTTTMMGIGGTIGLICAIWVLYEVWAVGKHMRTGEKLVWSIAAVCFNILTAIAFYIIVKRNTIAS